VAKTSRSTVPVDAVRTRRAYFDCRFGQLHVRTAFPTTGGFDEQVTLFCLHAAPGSSRMFARFLPEIADVRSVYAPDLPGLGESDPSPTAGVADASSAVSDLANDLRLRQIDLLGVRSGAEVALELAAARPDLVRRLVLVDVSPVGRAPVKQPALLMRVRPDAADGGTAKLKTALMAVQLVDLAGYTDDLFEAAAKTLAAQIGAFLAGHA
jgi:pimeloyl-ACP methyl ester carboxylesterase